MGEGGDVRGEEEGCEGGKGGMCGGGGKGRDVRGL